MFLNMDDQLGSWSSWSSFLLSRSVTVVSDNVSKLSKVLDLCHGRHGSVTVHDGLVMMGM